MAFNNINPIAIAVPVDSLWDLNKVISLFH